jgi:hypothetical protein
MRIGDKDWLTFEKGNLYVYVSSRIRFTPFLKRMTMALVYFYRCVHLILVFTQSLMMRQQKKKYNKLLPVTTGARGVKPGIPANEI